MGVALLAFVLSWKFWINATPIWALLIFCALNPVLDHFRKGAVFQWTTTPRTTTPLRTN
jgi:hypothetical protein